MLNVKWKCQREAFIRLESSLCPGLGGKHCSKSRKSGVDGGESKAVRDQQARPSPGGGGGAVERSPWEFPHRSLC